MGFDGFQWMLGDGKPPLLSLQVGDWSFTEFDDEAGLELARKVHFDEADVDAGGPAGWSGTGFGHPGEDARSAADW